MTDMKINFKIRLKNKAFWLALIPALALVAQAVAALFGYTIDLTTLVGKLQAVVNAVFALLAILGIVVDPTTEGVSDSNRAMSYEHPWNDNTDKEE
jgi:phi LC3 family holin